MPNAVQKLRGLCLGVLVIVGVVTGAVLPASRARAEDMEAVNKITDLNKKALEAYDALDFEQARKLLKQALDLCSSSGLDNHPIAARTHIHMGVVLIAGLKQKELGMKQFKRAIEIQPEIKVTKSLANPEIQAAFDEAASSGGGGTTEPDGGGTETPPSGGGTPPTPPSGGGAKPAISDSLTHSPVTQGKTGTGILITVQVSPELSGYEKVVLAYKPEGATEFLARDMVKQVNTYGAEIPASATGGSSVSYYIEAQSADETAVASAGSEEQPFQIALSGGGAVAAGGDAGGGEEGGEEEEGETELRRFYVGLGFGSGMGYTSGYGEVNASQKVKKPGFAMSTLVQIAPEVGYFINPNFRISVQLRYQIVTGATPLNPSLSGMTGTGCGSDGVCNAAKSAIAGFVRGSWMFRPDSSLHPFFSLALGAGQIRHEVKFSDSLPAICGTDGKQTCVDTVLAGPVFAGPGGGVYFALTDRFGVVGEASTFVGFPNFTFHVDLNLSVAARL